MKPMILDDRTFRLASVSATECTDGDKIEVQNLVLKLARRWLNAEITNWLIDQMANHHTTHHETWIDGSTYTVEVHLVFERPEDAVAFRLRWM